MSLVLAAGAGFTAQVAHAQTFPTKTVRIVVPFPPGGGADSAVRLIGQKLSERWGQQVVVENRPGANTAIAAEAVAKSPADGHTILYAMDTTLVHNQALFSRLAYDPIRDFAPITMALSGPGAVVVSERFKGSLADWVAQAKARPGALNYGVSGVSTQLPAALFERLAGIRATAVVYKGSAPTAQGLLAGDVDLVFDGIASYLPHIRSGRVRVLATTGARRAASLPDVPTVQELGYKDFEMRVWFGFVAPAGTPREVIAKLNTDFNWALGDSEFRARIAPFAMEPVGSTPEQFAQVIDTEARRYGPLIRELGLKLD